MQEETDLLVSGEMDLREPAAEAISLYRKQLKDYIAAHQDFAVSLEPIDASDDAPEIVKTMAKAAALAGVGPMAAVAGAVAESVGQYLLRFSPQVIVENGGDIFIKTSTDRVLGIYAAESPFTGKLALKLTPDQTPMGVCTSSGTVGHSLSFGKADAAIVFSRWTALADAGKIAE